MKDAGQYPIKNNDGAKGRPSEIDQKDEWDTFSEAFFKDLGIPLKNRNKRIAFGWYGGKFSHLDWLLPLLPYDKHFCEPFGGSGAVLLNRDKSPVETYNDLDGEVVNFFKVLRSQRENLIEAITLTPFSREELAIASSKPNKKISDLERARRFYVCARQVRTGLAQTASAGRWASCKLTSRRGMGGAASRWWGGVNELSGIAARLARVQIDNRPAIDVIKAYDSPETVFYLDPPYPHESRGDAKAYGYEMTDDEHEALSEVVHNAKGKIAISSYHCDLMDNLYNDWECVDAPAKMVHSVKQMRTEALWINYDLSITEYGQPTKEEEEK